MVLDARTAGYRHVSPLTFVSIVLWLYGFFTGLPNGQLPILEVDGYVLPQSMAILRYIGRLGGKDERTQILHLYVGNIAS